MRAPNLIFRVSHCIDGFLDYGAGPEGFVSEGKLTDGMRWQEKKRNN
jgi:hypothetical protein